MTIPVPPGHSSVTVTNCPTSFDLIPMSSSSATGTSYNVSGINDTVLSGCTLNLRFNMSSSVPIGNYMTGTTKSIGLSFS